MTGNEMVAVPPGQGTSCPRYGKLDEIGRYRGNSHEHIHDVGGKRPNPWGLHGVLGDVWDLCRGVYDAEVHGACRVLRGGGWFDGHYGRGFRVARSVGR